MAPAVPGKDSAASPGVRAAEPEAGGARVAFVGEAALVAGVRAGNRAAMAELHARFAAQTLRIVARVLGPDPELADVHHDVFVRALQSIDSLRDPQALPAWMNMVAVHTARASIERRASRRRWLFFKAPEALPEPVTDSTRADDDAREALRATYDVLGRMPVDDRIAFALRYVEGLELTEVAAACNVSLATIKRRLARADARFSTLARSMPALRDRMQEGSRWTER